MRKILWLLPVVLGCQSNSDLNVPISEKLNVNIVEKYSRKDTLFQGIYDEIRVYIDSVYRGRNEFEEHKNTTYLSLYNYATDYHLQYSKRKNNFIDEWKDEFYSALEKFELDSLKWDDYIANNQYKNFIEVDVVRFYEERDWLGIKQGVVDVKITPLNGYKLQKLAGFLTLNDRGEAEKSSVHYDAIFRHSGAMTSPIVLKASEVSSERNRLINVSYLPVETVLQKYTIDFHIHELVMNDKYLDAELDSLPYFFKIYIDTKDLNYRDSYIRTQIDTTYMGYENYVNFKIVDSLSAYHPKALDFFKGASKIRQFVLDSLYNE